MQTKTIVCPCGEVIGEITDYGARFRGVRYATAKRFEKPVEITHYDEPQDATKQGVCCPQMRAFWNEEHRFYYQEFRRGFDGIVDDRQVDSVFFWLILFSLFKDIDLGSVDCYIVWQAERGIVAVADGCQWD